MTAYKDRTMSKKKASGIKFGDPRIFFESTTTQPFAGANGINYGTGAVVRGAAVGARHRFAACFAD